MEIPDLKANVRSWPWSLNFRDFERTQVAYGVDSLHEVPIHKQVQLNLGMPADPGAAAVAPADPAADGADADGQQASQIPPETVVYAFSEVQQDQNRVPQVYLGEFHVVQSQPPGS